MTPIFSLIWLVKITHVFDFEITPAKVWNVYYPKKGVTRDLELVYPGNISGFKYEKDALDMVNELFVKGFGLDDAAIYGSDDDTTQQGIYYLLQASKSYDSDSTTVLDQEAEKQMVNIKAPVERIVGLTLKDKPYLGEYLLGDTVRVKIKHGQLLDFNELFRIEEIDVSIDEEDVETVNLGVVRA